MPGSGADPNATGNDKYLTEVDIRIFLRDYNPELNLLLDDYEFTHEEIRLATSLAVDLWNETPPDLGIYTEDTFPHRYHLLMGACANLLTMAAMRYRRNDLTYQIPGGAINDQNKAKEYDASAARMGAEYKAWVLRKKASENMESGWGNDWNAYRHGNRYS